MSVVQKYSSAIADPTDLTQRLEARNTGGKVRFAAGAVAVAAADNQNSLYDLFRIPGNAIILVQASRFHFDAFGSGKTVDLQVVGESQLLTDGLDVATAGSAPIFDSGIGIEKYGLPLWAILGYAADPAKIFTVQMKLMADAAQAADVSFQVGWTSNN